MTRSPCQQFREKFNEIEMLQKLFAAAVADAAQSGDTTRVLAVERQLKEAIAQLKKEIRESTDPFGVIERDRIAKEKGFIYVGVFTKEGLAVARDKAELYHVIDKKGERMGPGNVGYTEITALFERTFLAGGSLYSIKTGDPLLNILSYDLGNPRVTEVNDGVIHVKGSKGHLFFDTEGNVIGEKYYEAEKFSEGKALVREKGSGLCYYIDKTGRAVTPKYAYGTDFYDGRAFVAGKGEHSFHMINEKGDVVGEAHNGVRGRGFSDGLVAVEDKLDWYPLNLLGVDKNTQVIDTDGKKIFSSRRMEHYRACSEGVFGAHIGGSWQLRRKDGSLIGKGFKEIGTCSEGLIAVEVSSDSDKADLFGEQFGYIDKNGTPLLAGRADQFPFENAKDFHNGVAWVHKRDGTGWELIGKDGNFIPLESATSGYRFIEDFRDGVSLVRDWSDKPHYIDTKGRRVFAEKNNKTNP